MKCALILTGYMRNWSNNFYSIEKEILNPYSPDIFISSYTYSKFFWNSNSEVIDFNLILKKYNPKKYIFRESETCPNIKFQDNGSETLGRDYSIRQLYGWYTHKLALKLLNFEEYDIVIKLRPDVAISGFKIDKKNDIIIPEWKYHPGPCEAKNSYVDYIAYGNSTAMKGYFQIFDKLEEMHNSGIDISLGETLLKNYLDKYVTNDVYKDDRIDWISYESDKWASEKGKIFPPNLIT